MEYKYMTTANKITIVRMALIPVYLVLMYLGLVNCRTPDGRIVQYGASKDGPQGGTGDQPDKKGDKEKPKRRGLFGWGK